MRVPDLGVPVLGVSLVLRLLPDAAERGGDPGVVAVGHELTRTNVRSQISLCNG